MAGAVVSKAIATLPFAVVVFVFVKIFLSYWRLRHIPGPWLASFTPFWLGYHTLKSDLYSALDDAIRKYGTPLRISPNIVVHHDSEIRKLVAAPRSSFVRGHWFEGMRLDPRKDNIVSMTDEKNHTELRAKLLPGYSGRDIVDLERDIDSQVIDLAQLIQKHIDNNEKFDFGVIASYFTTDALCKIAFGRVGGFLKNNRDEFDYFKTTGDFFPIMELGTNIHAVHKVLNSRIVQALAGPKPGDKVGLGAIMGLAYDEVATRFGPDAKPDQKDMLGSFVRHGLTKEECEVETVIQILAGADSTATALRVTFWYIVNTPRVYSRLCDEIQKAVENGQASWPAITDAETLRLPFLQACIREGTRMFMPLTGLSGMVCPPEGYTLNGKHIPGGTQLAVAMYSMLRREDIFGPDADMFRPERFIDEEPSKIKHYEHHQDLTFGAGRFSCLGKRISLMELRKVIFELFRRYDFSVANPLEAVKIAANGTVIFKNMMVRAHSKLDV